MIVVIGAGPAGLYTAIKLRKEGIRVKDIIVIDPRAGIYTRPGHLNENAFRKAETGIGVSFWSGNKGHIKDFERQLYQQAEKLGINIEQKQFITLKTDPKQPAVIVANKDEEREEIPAEYVFDCTGSRREVIKAVNALYQTPPFQLNTIVDLPLHNHFLAYVRMSEKDLEDINDNSQILRGMGETYMKLFPGNFADSILKLRELGWNEFSLPRCYGVSFGKNKVCLYLQAPDNLAPEHYDAWVTATIQSYAPSASYEHLPPSKKYKSKPRFVPFMVNAHYLEQVSYQGKNLPTVIALGDTQIDPDYYLAHGIYNGMERIDALFSETMEIVDGKILYFDSEEYLAAINKMLKKHKEDIIDQAKQQKQTFSDILENIKEDLLWASRFNPEDSKREAFSKLLIEVEARIAYEKARKDFSSIHDSKDQFKEGISDTVLFKKLTDIQKNLIKAHDELPKNREAEKKDTELLLLKLGASWKVLGSKFFKNNNLEKAEKAFQKALFTYHLPSFSVREHMDQIMILYSNLTIVYLKNNDYLSAIKTAKTALRYIPSDSQTSNLVEEKLVFNLNKALCSYASELLEKGEHELALSMFQETKPLIEQHQQQLSKANYILAHKIIGELELKFNSAEKNISYL
ncbi:hypothetical protein FOG18_06950 [Legionella israelensis]|uniref:NAD(P)/FAD-dependent oxidoreductase n=1 Tax=Legionella israelensis TaxID=454 RepID=UPI00117EBB88|nr:FAD-dependent oxidoreductase [Legionella israelensis]QDP72311.1 hypothetical protein FOG18_06950 [Legionella israelensis]